MNKRTIFRTIDDLFLSIVGKRKSNSLSEVSSDTGKLFSLTSFDSYLDIPTFMRQGRVLSKL